MTDQNEFFGWSKAGVLRQGEQSPTDSEVTHAAEIDALRAEVERLKRVLQRRMDVSVLIVHAERMIEGEREACAKVLQHFFRRAEHPLPAGQSIPTNLQINRVLREVEAAIRARAGVA